jgi:hypothetical protein
MSDAGSPIDDGAADPGPDEERVVNADEHGHLDPGRLTEDPEANEADAQEQARDVPLGDDER